MKFRCNQLVRSQSFGLLGSRVRHSWRCFIPGAPLPSSSVSSDTRRCHAGAGGACSGTMSDKISSGNAGSNGRPKEASPQNPSARRLRLGQNRKKCQSMRTCRQAVTGLSFCSATRTRLPFMSTIELVDPELRDALAQPLPPLTAESLTQRRANALELAAAEPKPNLPDIATDEIHVESAFGAKPIRVLTYRPVTSNDPLPVIVHIHGGGFVMGAPEMKDVENRLFASELRCAIYSVDHRLAPESPHPAPLDDIYSVFAWLHANAGQLGLDPARIGIKGESGGGGFAAAAALYARDRQGPKFAFQHLIYPMIDDRTAVRKDLHPYVGEFVWTQENNYFGWRSLLGKEPGSAEISPYAAAARAADVSNLPPTYISVGGLDLFLEENLIYADRLSRAGVPVELHLYPRTYHGFYRATNARVTKQAEHDNREALRRFLHG